MSEYKSYKVAPHNETLTKLYDDADKAKGYGQKLGIALLVALMGLAFYNDISRLFG